MDPCPEKLVVFAIALADAARPISMSYFRTPIQAEIKHDKSPVTIADKEAEAKMREMIEAHFPEHGIFGEEYGPVRNDAEFIWVLDPIDGTKSFLIGKPLFGTLVGLLHRGRAIAGIVDMPALNERWIGATGYTTKFNGVPVSTRSCNSLSEAWMLSTSPEMFVGKNQTAFHRLKDKVHFLRYGTDCMGYGLLANGYADIVCEANMSPYDYIALTPVVEGAGGTITDWRGNPLSLKNDGTVLAVGDKNLLKPAMAALVC